MLFGMYGKMTANEGQRDALVANLLRAAELMKSVPGCLLYVVSTSEAESNTVYVTEVWKDEAAHGASLSMPGVRALVMETMPLLAAKPEGIRLRTVGGKGVDTVTS